jgi:L-lactate dehydrogenase complex protein LldG
VVEGYGGGSIVTWKDKRFSEWDPDHVMKQEWPSKNLDVYEWDYTKGEENISGHVASCINFIRSRFFLFIKNK